MKKGIMKRLGTALLSGLLMLTSLSLMPAKVQAATVTHGNVQIIDTDYSAICNRLKAKYPSIFLDAKVYQDGVEVGTETAVRVLITRSTNHLESGNQGATEKYINGTTSGISDGAEGLSAFFAAVLRCSVRLTHSNSSRSLYHKSRQNLSDAFSYSQDHGSAKKVIRLG